MRFHWYNRTESDDLQNRAHERSYHDSLEAQDAGREALSVVPRRRRFPWCGRFTLTSSSRTRRELSVEWCLGTASRSCGIRVKRSGWNLCLPFLISLYVEMPWWPWRWDPIEFSVHSGGLWWNFCTPELEWSSSTPRWRNGSWRPLDALFGSLLHVQEIDLETRDVLIPMPEGPYPARAVLKLETWKRQRWPWWPLARSMTRVHIDVPLGIPHEGKGENSWDCGEDAARGITTPAARIEDGIGVLVASCLRDRYRYGNSAPGAYPHPDVRAQRQAEAEKNRPAELPAGQCDKECV